MPKLDRKMNIMRLALAVAIAALLGGCVNNGLDFGMGENEAHVDPAANVASLSEVIKQNPKDAHALNIRGAVYAQQGHVNEALADFNAALAAQPNYVQALVNRALVYRRLNKTDLALADYNRALEIDPGYETAVVGRGTIFRQTGHMMEALNDFERAIKIKSDDPQAFHNRGLIYQARGMHDFAIDDFTSAIGLGNSRESYYARGVSHLAINDYKAAGEDFAETVRIDPHFADGWAQRGLALEKLGNKDEASNAYQEALNIDPANKIAREGEGRLGGHGGWFSRRS